MPDERAVPDRPRAVLSELRVVPPDAFLTLAGELDLHTVAQLRAAFDAVLAAPVDHLHLDLGAIDFISLSALGEVVDTARTLGDRDGSVVVRGASPLHRRVLTLLGAPGSLVVLDGIGG